MIESDRAKVPAQGQTLKDAGNKPASTFISADTKIAADGAVTGTFHHVDNVESFGKGGYFMPVKLDSQYEDTEITVTGINGAHTATDTEWLVQIEGTDTTVTFATNKTEVFLTLTFKGAQFEQASEAASYGKVTKQVAKKPAAKK